MKYGEHFVFARVVRLSAYVTDRVSLVGIITKLYTSLRNFTLVSWLRTGIPHIKCAAVDRQCAHMDWFFPICLSVCLSVPTNRYLCDYGINFNLCFQLVCWSVNSHPLSYKFKTVHRFTCAFLSMNEIDICKGHYSASIFFNFPLCLTTSSYSYLPFILLKLALKNLFSYHRI